MENNTVTTVTQPDLYLNPNGPSILLMGITHEQSKEYKDLYDKLFTDVEITVFVSEDPFSENNAAWFRAVAGMSSTYIVDIDNISIEEFFLAMQASMDNKIMVFWISKHKKKPILSAMLNSYQYQTFNSIEEIKKFLLDELQDF